MGLRERWANRGKSWRFPSAAEARDNLRRGFGALRRPWVIPLLAVFWTSVLVATWGMTDNTVPMITTAMFSGSLLYALGPPRHDGS
jgi:hypothetical protein